MNIYFAAPMFAKSEQIYNSYLVEKIRKQYPQLKTLFTPRKRYN
ncbi:hypothetical protein TMUPMC115_1464 [Tetragenococcus muriaticus PMC-11-5]|uniref:Uncharacterized protein n=1 Tax=Tetragenococcus muriaticus PMC-11-5 TaxID=1302649 RepID=A0A091C308_9ENTE|nr:hypothetical protein TMUPMC115_1464 [Tetragenococcus muriaticus PMC-11-5]